MNLQLKGSAAVITGFFLATCNGFVYKLPAAGCASPPPGLVAWWRGENTAVDAAGNNHGLLQNGVTFAVGRVGQAFDFDGINDFVQIPDAPDLSPPTITIEAWVNPATINTDSRIVSKELQVGSCVSPFVAYSLDIRADHGQHAIFYFTTTNNASLHQLTGTSVIPVNQFTHLAATYDGTNAKLYVNGALEDTLTIAGSLQPSATPVTLGNAGAACRAGYGGTVEFNGLIDEASIYNRALTVVEVQALFNAGDAGKCALPFLTIVLTPTNTTVISWPSPSTDFELQQNTNNISSVNWSNVVTTPTDNGTNKFIVVSPLTNNRFYRLVKP